MRGMPPVLKWLGAFAGMALVVAVTLPLARDAITASFSIDDVARSPLLDEDDDEGDEPADPPDGTPAGPVEDGAAVTLADLSARDDTVRQSDDEAVAIGGLEGDAVYLAFALIPGDPACVDTATLELTLLEATTTELGVYPADVPDLAELEDDDPLPPEPLLTDQPRAIALTDGTPGVLQWDVTELYREWTQRALAQTIDPFVVAVRPPEYGDEALRVQFAALEAGEDDAGRLVWTGAPGCP